MNGFTILPVKGGADLQDIADLFRAYAASLPVDLGYQGFEAELAGLPGKYAPPTGALLIARAPSGEAIGCVAMRPMQGDGLCEMKRLYVSPVARGLGLGPDLIRAIIGEARAAGYRRMRLDTLPTMQAALALYARAGFTTIGAYYPTPVEGTIFLELRL
ncbi:MAG: GNAT family N-acetyltransferase [Sphingomonas sp.]|nr:GNAT family N-acetyltransferase [Sphingomonas sp.]